LPNSRANLSAPDLWVMTRALGWLWGAYRLASNRLWGGFDGALMWLWMALMAACPAFRCWKLDVGCWMFWSRRTLAPLQPDLCALSDEPGRRPGRRKKAQVTSHAVTLLSLRLLACSVRQSCPQGSVPQGVSHASPPLPRRRIVSSIISPPKRTPRPDYSIRQANAIGETSIKQNTLLERR
jgi:hypothetical protein